MLPLLADFQAAPLALSLRVAFFATLLALAAGLSLGWWLARTRMPGRGLVEALCMLPLVLPPTVLGYALLVLMGRQGALGAWLREHFDYTVIFHWHGAVLASALVALPLVLKGATTAFAQVDPQLEAAARTLRQTRLSVFLRVSLPLAWPGILAGSLLAFARAMGEFGASLMVAGSIPGQTQTAAMAIYDAVQAGQDETAFRLALWLSLISVLILLAANHLLGRKA
jgi:molybdate transport system permease protein